MTVKAHIIEVHLFDSIRRFRGLGKHDEEFMERDHQNGCLNDRRSANIKDYSEKAKLHANWDRLAACPDVLDAGEEYEQKRRKRKADDNRALRAEERLEVKKLRIEEKRQKLSVESE